MRRRLQLCACTIEKRSMGWSMVCAGLWSIIGSAWYGTRAKHPSAQRRDQVNLRLETASHTIPPPLLHRSLSRRARPHPLSSSYPRPHRYASPRPLRLAHPRTHAVDVFTDGGRVWQPVNREGALGEKALIDDIARKLGGTTLLTTLENSLTPGEK